MPLEYIKISNKSIESFWSYDASKYKEHFNFYRKKWIFLNYEVKGGLLMMMMNIYLVNCGNEYVCCASFSPTLAFAYFFCQCNECWMLITSPIQIFDSRFFESETTKCSRLENTTLCYMYGNFFNRNIIPTAKKGVPESEP